MWADYDSPAYTVEEFEGDAMRVIFVTRLLRKYQKNGSTNVRFIINHLVILNNLFPNTWAEAMLDNIEDDLAPLFFAVLIYMHRINPAVPYCRDFLSYIESETS